MKVRFFVRAVLGLSVIMIFAGFFSGCRNKVPKAGPVQNFDAERYSGKWYEIARMDFAYEKNMSNVTAEYYLNDDGSIKVTNSGFDTNKQKWKQIEGKARFVDSKNNGALRVSFFGPFYTDYTVIEIDPDYQYALVAGQNTDLMWILSRTDGIPDKVKNSFLETACKAGYDVEKLVWTSHESR